MKRNIFSSLRYILWIFSGSEISLLKACKTDYNKHANIGLAIFVTSLIAMFTGGLAGYDFGMQNYKTAILFGLLWGLLVFTIDRNMVLTLKKDPTLKKQKLVLPVLYRMLLSALIAFIIAIPLELVIFKDVIAKQIIIDNDEKILQKRNVEQDKYGIDELENDYHKYDFRKKALDSVLQLSEPNLNYKNYRGVKEKLNIALNDYKLYKKGYDELVSERKKRWSIIPEYYDTVLNKTLKEKATPEYQHWRELWYKTKPRNGNMTIILNQKKSNYEFLENKLKDIENEYFAKLTDEKNRYDSLLLNTSNRLALNKNSIEIKKTSYESFIGNMNGFITKWSALNNIQNGWVIFFIWFIRFVFFIIEMLPTFAKVFTPVGSYDWVVYYAEMEKKKQLESHQLLREKIEKLKSETDFEIFKQKEKQRIQHDLDLQKKLLEVISSKQINLTKDVLNKWEKEHQAKIKAEIEDIVKDISNNSS